MTSIDDLFKKPQAPNNGLKRKEPPTHDPSQFYKSAKHDANGDAKHHTHASVADEVEEEDDMEAGPAPPPSGEDEEDGADEDEEGRFFGSGVDAGTRDAMDYLDTQEEDTFTEEKIDSAWIRRQALNFEKKISKNAELRARYEDEPTKFMASEADLDTEIKALSILTEHPELYEEFAKLGSVESLVGLLSHENTDIAIGTIEIISELTDEDVSAEQEQWDTLIAAALEADLLSLLGSNLGRFNENEEADRQGVYYTLSVIENLASQSASADKISGDEPIIKWLLDRIQKKESTVSQNKQYAAEIIAILVQTSKPNRSAFTKANFIDTALQLLAPYRKRDPQKDSEEEEYTENLFDALACCVDEVEGKDKFVEAEGVELVLIMLRESKFAKPRALRLLDHATGGTNGLVVCEKLIEAAGLKTIFGMFMKKQDNTTAEHLLGVFASFLRHLPADSAPRIRLLAKFMEKDYEKIVKLVSLRRDYATRLAAVKQTEETEDNEDELLSQRLDAGLFSLQLADTILAWLVAEDDGAKKKINQLLADRDESLDDVKATLKEQLEGIDTPNEESGTKEMLEVLIGFL